MTPRESDWCSPYVIAALIGLVVLATTTPTSASQGPKHPSLLATTPGFSWSMPERYNGEDRDRDGLADYFTPANYRPFRPAPGYNPINPSSWRVNLTADTCPSDRAVQWAVDGHIAGEGCKSAVFLSAAPHRVSVIYNGAASETESVTPKDWLIAVIGDSYGSGEGNPDVPLKSLRFRRDKPSRWQDKQCHRSARAGAALAAARIEKADAHSSVTLLHLSCSGATIEAGLRGSHSGQRPDDNKHRKKKPQVNELRELLGDRAPDALVISIGGNDVGFADIIRNCLLEWGKLAGPSRRGCYRPTSKGRKLFEAGMKQLPGRYDGLATALQPFGITPSRVLVTGYPDPTRYDDGGICGDGNRPHLLREIFSVPFAREISAKEARWASEVVGVGLNRALNSIARAHGWTSSALTFVLAEARRMCEELLVCRLEQIQKARTFLVLRPQDQYRRIASERPRTPGLSRRDPARPPAARHSYSLGRTVNRSLVLRPLYFL